MKKLISACLLASFAPLLHGQTPKAEIPSSCKVLYSMAEEDTLHNINQGLLASGFKEKDGLKWLKKMYKKYPDVCYVAPNTNESIEFFIVETPAVHHGTQVLTQTHKTQANTTGTVSDDDGNTASIDANTTGTTKSSVAVPYDENYTSFTLTVEKKMADRHFQALRRFQTDDFYKPAWGERRHPVSFVMEEAIHWIHKGGLNDPTQTVAQ